MKNLFLFLRKFLGKDFTKQTDQNSNVNRILLKLKGKKGTTCSKLALTGKININGRKYEAISNSGVIKSGALVKVVDIYIFQLVVEGLT